MGSFSVVVSSVAKAWETTQEPLFSSTYRHPGRQQFASADGKWETASSQIAEMEEKL